MIHPDDSVTEMLHITVFSYLSDIFRYLFRYSELILINIFGEMRCFYIYVQICFTHGNSYAGNIF